MTYFTPDRSNRPTADDDPTGGTTELAGDSTRTYELSDGRVAVVEYANVDGFTLVYYYFDATGLEDATQKELEGFIADSGIDWSPKSDDTEVSISSARKEDAQGRDIWEFQITYV